VPSASSFFSCLTGMIIQSLEQERKKEKKETKSYRHEVPTIKMMMMT